MPPKGVPEHRWYRKSDLQSPEAAISGMNGYHAARYIYIYILERSLPSFRAWPLPARVLLPFYFVVVRLVHKDSARCSREGRGAEDCWTEQVGALASLTEGYGFEKFP